MGKGKLTACLMVIAIFLTTASFAAGHHKNAAAPSRHEAANMLRGIITAVNADSHQITVQPDGGKPAVTVMVNDAASLQVGQHVKITLKAGTKDQAEMVKIIIPKNKK